MFKAFIGDRQFYQKLLTVTVPLVLQQLITTSVALVDNIMVGRLGETAISSVAVVNQLFFVIILVFFGLMGGAGIFSAQYFGSKDYEKLRETFRFKIISGIAIASIAIIILSYFGRHFIMLFTETETTISKGLDYLTITKWGIVPLVLSVAISSTFRETGITKPLLYISTVAVIVNTFLNYILIFGNFGAPRLEIFGAAIATLIARCVEALLMIGFLMLRGGYFATKIRDLWRIKKTVLLGITAMALPLTFNEFMWAMGQTMFLHAYSTRGDSALAALNITNAISQLVFVTFAGIGTGVAVLVGNTLGSNELDAARDNAKKLLATAVIVSIGAGILLFMMSFFIVNFYDVADITRKTAAFNIRVNAFFMPFFALNVGLYFVLRSGGDAKSTVMMDSGYMWVFAVPIALVLAYVTDLPVTLMFLIIQSLEFPKSLIAISRYKKGYWVKNLAVTPINL